ncbi:MAG: hypothetical protein SFY32_16720 [Bacteroidota bacterium]|nr:hypothetical protein [Bacteroidota bacterium]
MAKTFRNIQQHQDKNIPDSKKDILDFFDEETANEKVNDTEVTPKKIQPKEAEILDEIVAEETRQTFIISVEHLEKLKNYVYTQRRKGHFEYNQKNALEEAIDKLIGKEELIVRPEEVRKKEEKRKLKIRKGIIGR